MFSKEKERLYIAFVSERKSLKDDYYSYDLAICFSNDLKSVRGARECPMLINKTYVDYKANISRKTYLESYTRNDYDLIKSVCNTDGDLPVFEAYLQKTCNGYKVITENMTYPDIPFDKSKHMEITLKRINIVDSKKNRESSDEYIVF